MLLVRLTSFPLETAFAKKKKKRLKTQTQLFCSALGCTDILNYLLASSAITIIAQTSANYIISYLILPYYGEGVKNVV